MFQKYSRSHQLHVAKSLVKIVICLLTFLCSGSTRAQDPKSRPERPAGFIPLYPEGKMPNSLGLKLTDSVSNDRMHRVGTPGMLGYFPSAEENKKSAVLICPGGGYERLAYNVSGTQLAKWFNTIGICAFVLNYRLPNSSDLKQREIGPLQDAQRALKYIRANATRWGIDKDKIGIQGSSAGGHLASLAGITNKDVSSINDSLDNYSFHPDFIILISPVIDLGKYAHKGSRSNLLGNEASPGLVSSYSNQLHVTGNAAPAFIIHAYNDKAVDPHNSLLFYTALLEHGVPSSLHIFPQGAHAIVLKNNPGSLEMWTDLCEAWLREMKFL